MTQDSYSDEILNAYLDSELSDDDHKQVADDLRTDPVLRQRVCKLEQTRKMVSLAYHDLDKVQTHPKHPPRKVASIAAVFACFFVIVGAIAGWYGHQHNYQANSLVQLADDIQLNQHKHQTNTWRILLHITSYDPYRLNTLLNETETVLNEYHTQNKKVAIQILTNGQGLNLLRSDKSAYGKRISSLQKKYNNLVFVACAQAIERIKQEEGIKVELLPNTKIAPSALGEVINRQIEGWTYIKI